MLAECFMSRTFSIGLKLQAQAVIVHAAGLLISTGFPAGKFILWTVKAVLVATDHVKSDLHDSMSRRLAFSELHNASGSIREVIYLCRAACCNRESPTSVCRPPPNNGDFNPSWIKCFGTAYSGHYTFCIQVCRKSIHHSIQRSLICEHILFWAFYL